MIDISDLMTDPDFASPYQVIRQEGKWVKGRFERGEPATLNFYGPVQPASVRELEQFTEADRQKSVMTFWCKEPNRLYLTGSGQTAQYVSDVVLWRGERYKLIQVMPWNHIGWMQAFGCLMEGENDSSKDKAGT